jgi:hypothetical protein
MHSVDGVKGDGELHTLDDARTANSRRAAWTYIGGGRNMAKIRKVEKAIRAGKHPRHTIPAKLEEKMGMKTRQSLTEPPADGKRWRRGHRSTTRPGAPKIARFR